MKIEDANNLSVNIFRNDKDGLAAAKETGNLSDTSAEQLSGKDNVRLSPTVERLNKANAFMQVETEFRGDRVAELKSKIETGNYRVSSTTVSEKMLARTNKGPLS